MHTTVVESKSSQSTDIYWGHGWGLSGESLLPLATALSPHARSFVLDLPGFGRSEPPPSDWGTADYADQVAALMSKSDARFKIWIGHSFGGRIGIQLAARHPTLVSGLILIAAAGLRPRRTLLKRIKMQIRISSYKIAKAMVPEGPSREKLRNSFGSRDYRSAGNMRQVMVKVVGEDLSHAAATIGCPTLLLYGNLDSETPPEMGARYQALIPNAELAILTGFSHESIIREGRHQVVLRISNFLKTVCA